MPQVDLVVFDLDGTLIDSKADLVCAVNATRGHLGRSPLPDDVVSSYVGNGAPVLMRRSFPDAGEEELQSALQFFLAYYRQHPLDYTRLYPGTSETLSRLAAANVQMAVLTNKPLDITRQILEGLGAADRFVRVYGGESFPKRKPDPIGLNTLLRECSVERERCVMVGDSAVDVQTARNASILACGVTYGFQPESLMQDRPDLLFDRMEQVGDWVLAG